MDFSGSEIKPEGYKEYLWPNGYKRLTGTWTNGKKNGLFTYYNEDGTVNTTINYVDDHIDGEVKRYYNDQLNTLYNYEADVIITGKGYINNTLIGEYTYSDSITTGQEQTLEAPEVGTIFHAYNGKHPSELFPGTLWTYVENSYELDANGKKVPVDIWLREAGGIGTGASDSVIEYIYNGPFSEYRSDNGSKIRTGNYIKVNSDGEPSKYALDGEEILYKNNDNIMYHCNWRNGSKIGSIEFYDDNNRIWKRIDIANNGKFTSGVYNVISEGINGNIEYTFDPNTQAAKLKLQK